MAILDLLISKKTHATDHVCTVWLLVCRSSNGKKSIPPPWSNYIPWYKMILFLFRSW